MSDLDALLTAAAESDDRTTWLVLADALDEAGRAEEAALIRSGAAVMARDGEVLDADVRTYWYHEYEHCEELDAADMDEAVELARELCRGGDWGVDGAVVDVWVVERDAAGDKTDRRELAVEIEPDHEALIRAAVGRGAAAERCCGTDPDDHDWTGEGEGGCDSNPGVWSTGGTSMSFASHCRACGLHRSEHTTGSQRNPGEHDTVRYEMPADWCPDCEREDCRCEYRVVETASGWAVERREDGARAEFLGSDEAAAAAAGLRSGAATDRDYDWAE